jgi:hypothetical protein
VSASTRRLVFASETAAFEIAQRHRLRACVIHAAHMSLA